ncbi:MAG: hypothetical protein AAGH53_03785 [Pseudomonadota bacterium]
MFKKYVETILKNAAGISKISFPGTGLTFSKDEFVAMMQSPESASRILAECFVSRRVFWEDFSKERPDYVLESLQLAVPELRKFDREFAESNDLAFLTTARWARYWGIVANKGFQGLRDHLSNIQKEKNEVLGYEDAHFDRNQAMTETLLDVRLKVYPAVRMFIEICDDGDPIIKEAKERMNLGMQGMSPEQIQGLEPQIDFA